MKSLITLITLITLLIILTGCNNKTEQEKGHAGHGHNHDQIGNAGEKLVIGEEAIKNMGAEIRALTASDFTVFKRIPARVVNVPTNKTTLYAPWGGIISNIQATVSEWKDSGEVLVEITRDPLPRMVMTATETILKVSAEDYHEALMDWRKVKSKLITLKLEQDRLDKVVKRIEDTLPLIPKKDLLKLKYDIINTQAELSSLEYKLKLHGVSEDQLKSLMNFGKGPSVITPGLNFWINALKANGLWQEPQNNFLKILPEKHRARRWTIQCIAELFAGDYLGQDELEVLKKDKLLLENFGSVASLIQQGYTLSQLKKLSTDGLFDEIIKLKIPLSSCIETIRVRPNQKVERGTALIDLHSPENMIFELEARGTEKIDLRSAVKANLNLEFRPVTEESSAVYPNLKITSILSSEKDGLIKALVPVSNKIIAEHKVETRRYLSWDLVEGTRFYANIPLKQLKDVYVMPAQSVLDSGPDKVILVREGGDFVERKVIVLYRNSKFAVLSEDSDFISGEPVVFENAFEVLQAVQSGTRQPVEAHSCQDH